MNRYNYLPFFTCAVLFVITWFLKLVWGGPGGDPQAKWNGAVRFAGVTLAIGLIAGYVGMVIYYVVSPTHIDHAEPAIVSCSHLLLSGQPVYQDLEAAPRYSMLYGPSTYCLYAMALWLLPSGLFACKVLAGLAALGTVALGGLCLSKCVKGRPLVIMTGLMCGLCMANVPNTFWTRADPLIGLCVAFALWAAISRKGVGASLGLGIACGLAVNLKINAAFHFIFPLLILFHRAGWQPAVLAVAVAMLTACIPFLLPNISFWMWLRILLAAGKVGLGANEILWSSQWLLFLCLPIAIPWLVLHFSRCDWRAQSPGMRLGLLGILASLTAQSLFASKAGSDPTQFVPLIPIVLYGCGGMVSAMPEARRGLLWSQSKWLRPLALAFFLTAAILGAYQWTQIAGAIRLQNPFSRAVNADLSAIMTRLPGRSIVMGCGGNETEFVSNHFLPLVLNGHPYFIEPVALMEFEKAGVPIPQATRDVLRAEKFDVWLIPRNNPPFAMLNLYRPNRPLFDPAFRQDFEAHYQKIGSSSFFDVYVRKTALK